jgi:hypothetical protein
VQQSSLHERRSQPVEQTGRGDRGDKEVDVEVSTRSVNKEKLNRRKPARAAGKKQQQQKARGAGGQLQRRVWDPGGFQHWSRGAHEQELMIFPAVEYDAGASLHLSNTPTFQHIKAHSRRGEAPTLSFFPHF